MNPEINSSSLKVTDTELAIKSAKWIEHEHVSEQVQVETQNLVDLVGSSELAKNAVEIVEQRQCDLSRNDNSQTPKTVQRPDPFLMALKDFESSLETPIVSSDLINRTKTASSAYETSGERLCDDVQRKHAALYASIAREDSELSSRIEQLRATARKFCSSISTTCC